ncbi:MAG: MauE/DoxX family redox-associated membrane protein [Phycisphaerales bacterium JB038]
MTPEQAGSARMQRLGVQVVVTVMQGALPLLLFFTAIGKVLAWEEFEASLTTFALVPAAVRDLAAILVPASEAAAFVLFVVGLRVGANVLSLLLLALFFVVTLWHWAANVPPDCACMGLWARYWRFDESARGILVRDGYLMAYVAIVLMLTVIARWRSRLCERKVDAGTQEI